jgi:hypothetical protein
MRARSPAARTLPPRRAPRALRRDDAAVSEVIGYIMVFALSAGVLILSLQAFMLSRDTTDNLRAAQTLRIVSERVAAEVQQASIVAAEMSDASYEGQVSLPTLSGRSFYIQAWGDRVYANSTDGRILAESGVLNVQELGSLTLQGTVQGSQGYVKVRYDRVAAGTRSITLTI